MTGQIVGCITIRTKKTTVATTHTRAVNVWDGFYLGSFASFFFLRLLPPASPIDGGVAPYFDRIRNPAHSKIEINKEEGTEGGRDFR